MTTYTRDDVLKALNEAADDIIETADLPDTGARDAMNLLVNVAMAYLDGEPRDVRAVIEGNYSAEPDEVLGWLTSRDS